MLVLSRKIGERLLIGDHIVIHVLEMKGHRVRIGIEAPPEVPVWREELAEFREPAATPEPLVVKKSR
jgi:carbon storage regulator